VAVALAVNEQHPESVVAPERMDRFTWENESDIEVIKWGIPDPFLEPTATKAGSNKAKPTKASN
jgi:hypothetical protein